MPETPLVKAANNKTAAATSTLTKKPLVTAAASETRMDPVCRIIGVLENATLGLTPAATQAIGKADIVIGAARTLNLFKTLFKNDSQQYDLTGKLSHIPQWVSAALDNHQQVVVLATGDPLCHGIGKYLLSKLGQHRCEILTNVSAHQLAFAQLGLTWQQAHICSVHAKDAGEWAACDDDQNHDNNIGPLHGLFPVLQAVQSHDLIAIYTSPENSPDRIARMLISEGLQNRFSLSVAEDLLGPEQRIVKELSLESAAGQSFASPNIVILQRLAPLQNEILFGLADQEFKQRKPDKGLITKREVRALSLARLQLRQNSIVWDIGAGSGAVGLEAARLCSQGYVYAMEKNPDDVAIALSNKQTLNISNYHLTHAKAPDKLDSWPAPDAVFIGGSGGELHQLIELCLRRMKPGASLVMNFVTLENLSTATTTLQQLNAVWDVTQLQASRSQPILHMHRLQAENPVWIVSARAQTDHDNDAKGEDILESKNNND